MPGTGQPQKHTCWKGRLGITSGEISQFPLSREWPSHHELEIRFGNDNQETVTLCLLAGVPSILLASKENGRRHFVNCAHFMKDSLPSPLLKPWLRVDFVGKKGWAARSKHCPCFGIGNFKSARPCFVSQHRWAPQDICHFTSYHMQKWEKCVSTMSQSPLAGLPLLHIHWRG